MGQVLFGVWVRVRNVNLILNSICLLLLWKLSHIHSRWAFCMFPEFFLCLLGFEIISRVVRVRACALTAVTIKAQPFSFGSVQLGSGNLLRVSKGMKKGETHRYTQRKAGVRWAVRVLIELYPPPQQPGTFVYLLCSEQGGKLASLCKSLCWRAVLGWKHPRRGRCSC